MTRAARTVASPHVVCIDDFRPLARRRLPRPVFDYLDGGADGEVTLRENCRIFDDVTFRPRHAVALSDCDLRTSVLGFAVSFPALLAPLQWWLRYRRDDTRFNRRVDSPDTLKVNISSVPCIRVIRPNHKKASK